MEKQIFIILGLPGSGKTTLLNHLKLNRPMPLFGFQLIDLDEYICSFLNLGLKNQTLDKWIEHSGFQKFRQVETECLCELVEKHQKLVLAIGGGAFTDSNFKYLKQKNAWLAELSITPEESIQRTKDDESRPLSKKPLYELMQILEDRKKIMQRVDCFISGTSKLEDQVLKFLEILQN